MTTLMYRGFAHDGTPQPEPVPTRCLIYRGVRHLGRTERDLKPLNATEMIYRGVRTVRTPKSREALFGELGATLPSSSVVRPAKRAAPAKA